MMRALSHIAISIVVFSGLSYATPKAELDNVTARNPRELTVANLSRNLPSLAVLVGRQLFFSEIRADKKCNGKNLYSYDLLTKGQSLEQEIECVHDLSTDGKTLFVSSEAKTAKGKTVLTVGDLSAWNATDKKLVSLVDAETVTLLSARALFVQHERDLPESKINLTHAVAYGNERLFVMAPSAAELFVDLFDLEKPKTFWHYPASLKSVPNVSETALCPNRVLAMVSWAGTDPTAMGKLGISNLNEDAPRWEWMGGATPVASDVNEVTKQQWGVTKPQYLTPTEHGLLVADRSSRVDEKAIWYLNFEEGKFRRLPVNAALVSGLAWVEGGVLVTNPTGKVRWYGVGEPSFETLLK